MAKVELSGSDPDKVMEKVRIMEARAAAEKAAAADAQKGPEPDPAVVGGAPQYDPLTEVFPDGKIVTFNKKHPAVEKIILANPVENGRGQRFTIYPNGSYGVDF